MDEITTVVKNGSEFHSMMQARARSLCSQKSSENKSSAASKDKEKHCSSESEVENEIETAPPSKECVRKPGNGCSDESTPIMSLFGDNSDNMHTMERLQ